MLSLIKLYPPKRRNIPCSAHNVLSVGWYDEFRLCEDLKYVPEDIYLHTSRQHHPPPYQWGGSERISWDKTSGDPVVVEHFGAQIVDTNRSSSYTSHLLGRSWGQLPKWGSCQHRVNGATHQLRVIYEQVPSVCLALQ